MISLWEPIEERFTKRNGGIEEKCIFSYNANCKETATYDKIYTTTVLFWTITDKKPYCANHKLKEELRQKIRERLFL